MRRGFDDRERAGDAQQLIDGEGPVIRSSRIGFSPAHPSAEGHSCEKLPEVTVSDEAFWRRDHQLGPVRKRGRQMDRAVLTRQDMAAGRSRTGQIAGARIVARGGEGEARPTRQQLELHPFLAIQPNPSFLRHLALDQNRAPVWPAVARRLKVNHHKEVREFAPAGRAVRLREGDMRPRMNEDRP